MAGGLVVREARPGDAPAIAEVSVASRRWSYRDLLTEAELEALSVERATADFAEGLAELPPRLGCLRRGAGWSYRRLRVRATEPEDNVPVGTSELGSLYVTEDVAGTGVAGALMNAAVEHARAAGQGLLTLWVRGENGRARHFYEKYGMRPDGAERSGAHDVMPIEIHEIRYRMQLGPRMPSPATRPL